jgi:hypothetical protein
MSARRSAALTIAAAVGACAVLTSAARAQTVDPYYAGQYTYVDLGTVPGLPSPAGGVTFKHDDPDTMLIGGAANSANGAIYAVPLLRGCEGQILGFDGVAVLYAEAPNIDGGLAYGPDDVLFFTVFPNNQLGQIMDGSVAPDRIDDLTALGVSASVGTLRFVPPGFAGEGRLKIASYTASTWYDTTITPDGGGTFNIAPVSAPITIGGGPEGIVYIDEVNPLFDADSVLVSEYSGGGVAAYEIDANGDPVVATRRQFITGLGGAEGAAVDPVTGEFVFSTFGGGDRVIVVRGFTVSCSADTNGDQVVNVIDLLAVLADWDEACVPTDINRDGIVDVLDLLEVLGQWGPCP